MSYRTKTYRTQSENHHHHRPELLGVKGRTHADLIEPDPIDWIVAIVQIEEPLEDRIELGDNSEGHSLKVERVEPMDPYLETVNSKIRNPDNLPVVSYFFQSCRSHTPGISCNVVQLSCLSVLKEKGKKSL